MEKKVCDAAYGILMRWYTQATSECNANFSINVMFLPSWACVYACYFGDLYLLE